MNNTLLLHGLVGANGQGGPGSVTGWTRPADWLPMPTSVPQSIDILAAVFDHEANYCAVQINVTAGTTYNVDWGDGTSDLGVAANAIAEHLYDYAALGNLSALGYKQALIRITPTTGVITGIQLSPKPTAVTLANGVTNPWLDVTINAPNSTTLSINTAGAVARMTERVDILAIGNLTTLASTFLSCSSLQSVSFPAGSLSAVTTLANAFSACSSLQSVSFPAGSLSAVTTLASTFLSCSSLQSVSFPAGSLSAVTTLSNAFLNCTSLQSVTFPAGALAQVSITTSAFLNCFSLQSVSFPAGSLSAVTTLSNAFLNCFSLQSVTFPAGALAQVSITTSAFLSCYNLSNISSCTIPVTFTVDSLKLSGPALDEIYTALPTVTAQTITVTGNYGVATHTPSIATAKGWTVVQ